MSWLTEPIAEGRARVIGTTVKEHAGRWWVSFQIEIDRSEVNERRTVSAGRIDVRGRPRVEDVRDGRGRRRHRH
jgi:hypothetical protein